MLVYQDPPSRLNWGNMVINSRYIGSNRGYLEGLGSCLLFLWSFIRLRAGENVELRTHETLFACKRTPAHGTV